MIGDKKLIAQKNLQEQYSFGIEYFLENLKSRKEKIAQAVALMKESSESKFSMVRKINKCMLKLLTKLEASLEQKVLDLNFTL
ncbi:MAG: hypothetical protein ACTSR8_02405 [Promethearchaeota archaeon]